MDQYEKKTVKVDDDPNDVVKETNDFNNELIEKEQTSKKKNNLKEKMHLMERMNIKKQHNKQKQNFIV